MLARLDGQGLLAGQRVGLLGGSFDPPHQGHLHLSREALKRFGLDRVIWLMSPGNPLKPDPPAALDRRMAAARALIDHPRITVSDFEARNGTRYTAATLAALKVRHPRVLFTWLMGADNLAQLHRWEDWRAIMAGFPVGILARPGSRLSAQLSPAARIFAGARLPAAQAALLPRAAPPAWCFVQIPMSAASSTELRAAGAWPRPAAIARTPAIRDHADGNARLPHPDGIA